MENILIISVLCCLTTLAHCYTYTLTTSGTSIVRNDGAVIPVSPTNADYQAYLAWVAAGNTPQSRSVCHGRPNGISNVLDGLIQMAEAAGAIQ
jgi:hypothetical protein